VVEPTKQMTGIVIRADGTIPFEPGTHPEVKANALLWCMQNGHTVSPIEGGHLRIHNWKPDHKPAA
jgi:hypothetical protein